MSEYILKNRAKGYYYMQDVTTKEATPRLTRKGVKDRVRKTDPRGLPGLEDRLKRADANGSSCCHHTESDVARLLAAIESRPRARNRQAKKPAAKSGAPTAPGTTPRPR